MELCLPQQLGPGAMNSAVGSGCCDCTKSLLRLPFDLCLRLEGFAPSCAAVSRLCLPGLPPRYVVGCALVGVQLPLTSPLLCLLCSSPRPGAALPALPLPCCGELRNRKPSHGKPAASTAAWYWRKESLMSVLCIRRIDYYCLRPDGSSRLLMHVQVVI